MWKVFNEVKTFFFSWGEDTFVGGGNLQGFPPLYEALVVMLVTDCIVCTTSHVLL